MPSDALRVLAVDDQEWRVRYLTAHLEADGHAVIPAYDGRAALALAEAEQPDLILLDVMMPRMDGFEVCRRLRAHPATAHIPVVLTWAGAEADVRAQASSAGGRRLPPVAVRAGDARCARAPPRSERLETDLSTSERR
jgi:CheY-like chemotaxis protein